MANGGESLQEKIDKFEALIEQMKEETRESHSVLKALQHERKEIERLLSTDIKEMVNSRAEEICVRELKQMQDMLKNQAERIYDKVGREVDKIITLSLGKEFSDRRGEQDVRPLLSAKLREWLDEIVEGDK